MTIAAPDKRFLVAIRGKGHKPPLFLVHSLAGELTWLPHLAHRIDAARPIYGFAAPGLNVKASFFGSLEGMASAYLAALRSVQPGGPYLFGGYSFGGIVAYEMARQAAQAGDQIGKLILIDSYTPDTSVMSALRRWVGDGILILSVCNTLATEWGATALLEPSALPNGDPNAQVDIATRHLLAHCSVPHTHEAVRNLLEKCHQVMRVHTAMLAAYDPSSPADFHDTILIQNTLGFISDTNALRLPLAPGLTQPGDHGWRRYLRVPPQIIGVDAEHFLIMKPPAIAEVARIIDQHLFVR